MIRLELWVEGPTDASTRLPAGASDEPPIPAGGALIPLVRKALGDAAPREAEITARRLTGRLREVTRLGNKQGRRKLSSKGAKVLAALDQARFREPEMAIVAVWDRDGEDDPLRDRDAIHQALRERGARGVCVGICVEEVEAWLLADPGAFKRCFGRGPGGGLPGAPEDEADPKAVLDRVLSQYGDDASRTVTYRKLADVIEIETLERKCARGFGELKRAIEDLVAPHLRASRDA